MRRRQFRSRGRPAARETVMEMWKGASIERLHALHRLLTDTLLEALKDPEVSPAVLNAAVKFLKDNHEVRGKVDREAARRGLSRVRARTLGSH